MQDEELFVGGYIIRRIDEENLEIENTMVGITNTVSERYFIKLIHDLWRFPEVSK